MDKPFQISVIMPVYNAANFVQQAVESAIMQPQTTEVVLVEDGSTDGSWEICQKIASANNKVQLFRHPDNKNHGAGASRSLAVQKSTCGYIAFLDADDFYLSGRFNTAEYMFSNDPELEGVYEAIGVQVENEISLQRWKDAKRALNPLTTMKKRVSPEELFTRLVLEGVGAISIDSLAVKRRLFEKIGYFDESLQIFKVLLKDAIRRTRFNWQSSTRLSGFQKGVQLFMLPFEFPFVMKERAFWQAFMQLLPPIK